MCNSIDNCTKQIKQEINEKMHTNGNNIENIEFITFIKAARQRSSTAAQLRHENAGLLQIIADFDTRLATVEAERDALQQRLVSLSPQHILKPVLTHSTGGDEGERKINYEQTKQLHI